MKRHRTREMILEQKAKKPGRYAHTWQLRNKSRNVLRVNATPGGELADRVNSKLRNISWPMIGGTMVTETPGAIVTSCIYKTNPFRSNGCKFEDKCPVNHKQNCMEMSFTYELTCKLSKSKEEIKKSPKTEENI